MPLLYQPRRARPPTPAERRQLAVAAAAVVLGASATLAGFLVLVRDGQESLAMMLIRGVGLLLMVVGLFAIRPVVSGWRRRMLVVAAAGLALGWVASVVRFLGDR